MKNEKSISYLNIQSAIRPLPNRPGVPIPSPPDSLDNILDDHETLAEQGDSEENNDCYDPSTTDPIPFSQSELNN